MDNSYWNGLQPSDALTKRRWRGWKVDITEISNFVAENLQNNVQHESAILRFGATHTRVDSLTNRDTDSATEGPQKPQSGSACCHVLNRHSCL
jgi:hypothetical protein